MTWRLRYHTLKWYRKLMAKTRRGHERESIAHDRFDDLPTHYPRTIFWDYW